MGELVSRKVHTETVGRITVAQEHLNFGALKEIVMTAEMHGVDEDATVEVNHAQIPKNGHMVPVTQISMSAPTDFTYAPSKPMVNPAHRRRRELEKIVIKTTFKGVAAVSLFILMIGLFARFALWAAGWVIP